MAYGRAELVVAVILVAMLIGQATAQKECEHENKGVVEKCCDFLDKPEGRPTQSCCGKFDFYLGKSSTSCLCLLFIKHWRAGSLPLECGLLTPRVNCEEFESGEQTKCNEIHNKLLQTCGLYVEGVTSEPSEYCCNDVRFSKPSAYCLCALDNRFSFPVFKNRAISLPRVCEIDNSPIICTDEF